MRAKRLQQKRQGHSRVRSDATVKRAGGCAGEGMGRFRYQDTLDESLTLTYQAVLFQLEAMFPVLEG